MTKLTEEELREKIGEELDNFSYAVMGEYASEDRPERIDEIMQLIKDYTEQKKLEAENKTADKILKYAECHYSTHGNSKKFVYLDDLRDMVVKAKQLKEQK